MVHVKSSYIYIRKRVHWRKGGIVNTDGCQIYKYDIVVRVYGRRETIILRISFPSC